jgi:hypothetical protein
MSYVLRSRRHRLSGQIDITYFDDLDRLADVFQMLSMISEHETSSRFILLKINTSVNVL